MKLIRDGGLPRDALDGLAGYQAAVDGLHGYEQQVIAAKADFKRRNTRSNPVFKSVRATLAQMCGGHQRCGYCEDSVADEIEHVRPKDLFPEVVFAWDNYLYACGPCNGPKNNAYAIIERSPAGTPMRRTITRPRGAAVTPPAQGQHALIDPRFEDPLDYLILDIAGTFAFVELQPVGTLEHLRAEYTIEVLHLNDRESLRQSREAAFTAYAAFLKVYVSAKAGGATRDELEKIRVNMYRQPHPTVWAEMQRQHALLPSLAPLFRVAPEAATWS